jgi:hypothetical protein
MNNMSGFPLAIQQYLPSEILKQRSAAFLRADSEGALLDWGGELGLYGITNLKQGELLSNQIHFLQNLLPAPDQPLFLPQLRTESGAAADIHILRYDKNDYVLLLDAAAAVNRQTIIQQIAHNRKLQYEKDKKLREITKMSAAGGVTMNDSQFMQKLFAALDTIVLERKDLNHFRSIGDFPDWFLKVYPEANLQKEDLTFQSRLPFLENFLIDAEEFWSQNKPGRIRSGPWIETDYLGKDWELEASATLVNDRRILLIEFPKVEFIEKQDLIQKGREGALIQRRMRHKEKDLDKTSHRYQVLLSLIPGWVLVFDEKGLCLFSKTSNAEKQDKFAGQSVDTIFSANVGNQLRAAIAETMKSLDTVTLHFELDQGGSVVSHDAFLSSLRSKEVLCLIL